ncbi:hypothetical protein DPMN_161363 [Dreissena polymorpha]|uniref:Uncharacterized protein n=1 Tax=Dreissena polymorpha TaxID=45954 RepID=A0A9D4IR14_DREPO|nr:hypothetical protein DPMN_161363 [Dreissena polymorpha]
MVTTNETSLRFNGIEPGSPEQERSTCTALTGELGCFGTLDVPPVKFRRNRP